MNSTKTKTITQMISFIMIWVFINTVSPCQNGPKAGPKVYTISEKPYVIHKAHYLNLLHGVHTGPKTSAPTNQVITREGVTPIYLHLNGDFATCTYAQTNKYSGGYLLGYVWNDPPDKKHYTGLWEYQKTRFLQKPLYLTYTEVEGDIYANINTFKKLTKLGFVHVDGREAPPIEEYMKRIFLLFANNCNDQFTRTTDTSTSGPYGGHNGYKLSGRILRPGDITIIKIQYDNITLSDDNKEIKSSSHIIDNTQSPATAKQSIQYQISNTHQYQWSLSEALQLSISIKMDVGVPLIGEAETTISGTTTTTVGVATTVTHTEAVTVTAEVEAPPHTKVKATFKAIFARFEVPYTAHMQLQSDHDTTVYWTQPGKCKGGNYIQTELSIEELE